MNLPACGHVSGEKSTAVFVPIRGKRYEKELCPECMVKFLTGVRRKLEPEKKPEKQKQISFAGM